jgi:helix-turn-helix protein
MQQLADECLDERVAARVLNTAPATLQKWRWEGKGPRFLKVGRLVRYRRSELERYLASVERSSTSDSA